jgi:tetratricopeptide (TPR) repeat protein
MTERDSHRSRPVSKVGGASLLGVVLFMIWVLMGACFSLVFSLGDPLLRSFITVLVLVWSVLGPFALSFFFVELSTALSQNGFHKAALSISRMGISVDSAIVPLMHVCGMVDSPIAVMNLLNEATAMMSLGQFKEASKELEIAVDKSQGAVGWDNNLTQIVVGQLANCYFYLGRFSEAEKVFRRAIAAKKAQLRAPEVIEAEPELPLIVALSTDRLGLGNLYERQLKFEQAEEQYKQAIEMIEERTTDDTDFLADHLNAFGDLCVKTGRLDEAASYINKAFRIRRQIFPENHIAVASSYHSLGCLRLKQGNLYDSRKYLANAMQIKECFLGKTHPDIADTYRAIGELETAMNNYESAEDFLCRALAIMDDSFGTHPEMVRVLENLKSLYVKTGNAENVEKYSCRAEEIRRIQE